MAHIEVQSKNDKKLSLYCRRISIIFLSTFAVSPILNGDLDTVIPDRGVCHSSFIQEMLNENSVLGKSMFYPGEFENESPLTMFSHGDIIINEY